LDGHALPFKNESFDVIILYEAIYYLKNVGYFLEECRRLLRSGGHLLICSANKEWDGFNASPYSHTYFSISELNSILSNYPFETQYYGTFRVSGTSKKSGIISVIKRLAVALHLIPKTMKGKEFLKRLFLGTLVQSPVEITEDMAKYNNPEPISALSPVPDHKVIYATAKLTT
jgi:ubiquinone/menaquinone biosynthesis C-methylase UbiE